MENGVFRNTCPRGCFGTCSMLSYVKNGKLDKVTGDRKQDFTQGKMCAKGYASTQYIYHPKRLKYPMIQQPRGSGNWKRMNWDEAYTMIAKKLIDLNKIYGSNLFTAFDRYHGNIGMLHHAIEGMFNSIGPHTRPIGSPCAETGLTAMKESLGIIKSPDPENMANAKLIVIWGANPVATNVHQMKFIYQARRKGAIFVCIDPLFTKTAEKADIYIQINPGTDNWLALGVAKCLIENGTYSIDFVSQFTEGWEEYKNYVNRLDFSTICKETGVKFEAIQELAELYYNCKPAATWNGLGIQRTKYGKEIVSSINTLVALSGNLFNPNGGVYYCHPGEEDFPNHLFNHQGPIHLSIQTSREIDITDFAASALSFSDPPVKFLWIGSMNPLSQDQNFEAWQQLIKQLDLFVVVDLFMTKTAQQADIVLPAATHFEEEDLNVSYWHHWLSLNQKAIPNYYEAKSDLQIARELTRKLNELSPGFSNFPTKKEPLDWIKEELTPEVLKLYSIRSYMDLIDGPKKRQDDFSVLKQKIQFRYYTKETISSEDEMKNNEESNHLFRLLSPQSLLMIHSQFDQLSWLTQRENELVIEIPEEAAKKQGITETDMVEIYTDCGSVRGITKINPYLPKNVIHTNQAGNDPINRIITLEKNEQPFQSSTRYYDSLVKIRAWRG